MASALLQMLVIIGGGVLWRWINPAGLPIEQTRQVLTSVIYYFFLPALVLEVLWQADIGLHSLKISLLVVLSILSMLLFSWSVTRLLRLSRQQTGAFMLVSAFPNVTYLGLPVLQQVYGLEARSVVIQVEFFAASPLLFTVGIAVARYFGESDHPQKSWLSFLMTPPFIMACVAVTLNLSQIVPPKELMSILKTMSSAVVPVMLFALGLALSKNTLRLVLIPLMLAIVGIKLIVMPYLALAIADGLALKGLYKNAAVLDLAMPGMVLGIVFCDRYRLDSALYAMAVTVTTIASVFSLTFWYQQL
jgi:predicted permease